MGPNYILSAGGRWAPRLAQNMSLEDVSFLKEFGLCEILSKDHRPTKDCLAQQHKNTVKYTRNNHVDCIYCETCRWESGHNKIIYNYPREHIHHEACKNP